MYFLEGLSSIKRYRIFNEWFIEKYKFDSDFNYENLL